MKDFKSETVSGKYFSSSVDQDSYEGQYRSTDANNQDRGCNVA
jgi:hypothetical protein